jgi:hypothetical protein
MRPFVVVVTFSLVSVVVAFWLCWFLALVLLFVDFTFSMNEPRKLVYGPSIKFV